MSKILCIIQARMGATRLPNKVLMDVNSKPLLAYEIDRVKQSKKVDAIVIATTRNSSDDKIESFALSKGIDCFRGSEDDVLDRYYQCSKEYKEYETIVRITGDCPLIDPAIIDEVIALHESKNTDYTSNIIKETYPDGMDVEVFTRDALHKSANDANLKTEREHVTQYMRNNDIFSKSNLSSNSDYSNYRLTVDEKEDFEVISFLIENTHVYASIQDYITLLDKHPEIYSLNQTIGRNEGLTKSLKNDKK